jgi:hypothetical protein
MTVDSDGFWTWKLISQVASEIADLSAFTCQMVGTDGPAIQLAKQTNVGLAINEDVAGQAVRVSKPRILSGSEVFNTSVPSYAISSDGASVYFQGAVPPGTQITYQYRVCPYTVLSSPVALLAPLDPYFQNVAKTTEGQLVYQVREFIQDVSKEDGSYWAE